MQYSSYIKENTLRDIVQENVDCEQKLAKLRALLGLPTADETSEESENVSSIVQETETSNVVDLREDSRERILSIFKGIELRHAAQILREIEKSDAITWDLSTLEIKLGEETLSHTNLQTLLKKIVRKSVPTLPVGLVHFVSTLLKLKIPKLYFKDPDSLSIRDSLLKIQTKSPKDINETVLPANSQSAENETESLEASQGGQEEVKSSAEELVGKAGKRRLDDDQSTEDEENIFMPRRSKRLRLKDGISDKWESFNNS